MPTGEKNVTSQNVEVAWLLFELQQVDPDLVDCRLGEFFQIPKDVYRSNRFIF